jgi:hypothetical protein
MIVFMGDPFFLSIRIPKESYAVRARKTRAVDSFFGVAVSGGVDKTVFIDINSLFF